MSVYESLIFPILRKCDPEWAHDKTLLSLELAQRFPGGMAALRAIAGHVPGRRVRVCGIEFPNVIGMAAGFDKDARVAVALSALGFGHIEVGTLTPRPQAGNPRPRLFRLPSQGAVINRMGFPNQGVMAAIPRLKALCAAPRPWILGVSLGKQKETPLEEALGDYLQVMRAVYTHADYLAVNISSPNTPGLRELQKGAYLQNLCVGLVAESRTLAETNKISRRPVLVKIAPDLDDNALESLISAVTGAGIDGIIATNTTLSRDGVVGTVAKETGGLSGTPLRDKSTAIIAKIHRITGGKLPIIGVGGISTGRDALEKLDAGASLVQVYSGMVYRGPAMAAGILRQLAGERPSGRPSRAIK